MITVTDLFAGAGGSSQGIRHVPGVRVAVAANHWDLAVAVHRSNFPDALHRCEDIAKADFKAYPRTDLLWASPECTRWSNASGARAESAQLDLFGEKLPDEAAERSRATMWDVPRYLEAMIYRGRPVWGGVTENVVQVARGLLFGAWLQALTDLGYDYEIIYLNSMFARSARSLHAPQSRDRIYIAYWRRGSLTLRDGGRRPVSRPLWEKWLRPDAICPDHGRVHAVQTWKKNPQRPWGRYLQQYVYTCPRPGCSRPLAPWALAAAEAIDWNNLGTPIGDRPQPLTARTLARIHAGLAGTGSHHHPAATLDGSDTDDARVAEGPEHAILVPSGGSWQDTARPVALPMRTRTASESEALLIPYYRTGKAHSVRNPTGTVTTVDRNGLLIPPPGRPIDIDACLYRMLTADEIRRAMGFDATYTLQGIHRARVRMLGNAVTPCTAEILVSCLVEALTGETYDLAA
ncbi:DNA cytosine methyltransferase [Embleya sp. NPDC059237]|uniref:DNA cytosine methyltransferase n=1 Tax=Embleya sp. NPDC059237 TaxID=3346784 RepID=UPI0036802D46